MTTCAVICASLMMMTTTSMTSMSTGTTITDTTPQLQTRAEINGDTANTTLLVEMSPTVVVTSRNMQTTTDVIPTRDKNTSDMTTVETTGRVGRNSGVSVQNTVTSALMTVEAGSLARVEQTRSSSTPWRSDDSTAPLSEIATDAEYSTVQAVISERPRETYQPEYETSTDSASALRQSEISSRQVTEVRALTVESSELVDTSSVSPLRSLTYMYSGSQTVRRQYDVTSVSGSGTVTSDSSVFSTARSSRSDLTSSTSVSTTSSLDISSSAAVTTSYGVSTGSMTLRTSAMSVQTEPITSSFVLFSTRRKDDFTSAASSAGNMKTSLSSYVTSLSRKTSVATELTTSSNISSSVVTDVTSMAMSTVTSKTLLKSEPASISSPSSSSSSALTSLVSQTTDREYNASSAIGRSKMMSVLPVTSQLSSTSPGHTTNPGRSELTLSSILQTTVLSQHYSDMPSGPTKRQAPTPAGGDLSPGIIVAIVICSVIITVALITATLFCIRSRFTRRSPERYRMSGIDGIELQYIVD